MIAKARVERSKTLVLRADEVTAEIRDLATKINEDWFGGDRKLYWDNFWDRLDGSILADGSVLDLGDKFGTDAMKKLKKHIQHIRRAE